jgi:tRNA A-37 threonylcarbamoyl transferase component Bud32
MPDPAIPPLPSALDEDFEVIRVLGTGGMGAVWLVRDRFLDRLVALKVLLQDQSNPERRERFLREARTSARLEHPHIIDVYRADESNGVVWFTMRFIDGESLGGRIRDRGPIPVHEGLRILREVAWGLAYAHARGVIHRDIKPDNILLDRDSGRAVVTDFGIARDAVQGDSNLTLDGHVLGSVHFMSPEQASDEQLDGRSDIYALGCVAYLMFSGVVPFDGSAQSVLIAHVTREAPPLRTVAPQLPTAVCTLIERCLRKDPAQRFATADALATALDVVLREAEAAERAAADAAPGGVLSEADALAIWQRAAQLQAEAAHRLERTRTLQAPMVNDASSPDSGSYRIRDVEAAAVEAGISKQYVALAIAERQAQGTKPTPVVIGDRMDRQFTTFLGTPDRSISVSRVIPASPKDTLSAIGAVFTGNPYRLRVNDTVNGHPLDGGILRFTVPRLSQMVGVPQTKKLIYRLQQIALSDLSVTLQARGTAQQPACEVVITGDLREGLRRNLHTEWGFVGVGSVAAGAGTGMAAVGMGAAALAVVPGVLGGMVAAGAVFTWYRWLFRSALHHATMELDDLLLSLERHLTQRHVFTFPSEV